MKAYAITTGGLFGLLTIVHLLRIVKEPQLGTEPIYLLITALSAALSVWAFFVLRRLRA